MQAVRLHPAPELSPAYSPVNPAPISSLRLDRIPKPKLTKPGELLVRIKATTVIRDALTWPETYATEYAILGHDFSGIVEEVFENPDEVGPLFMPGDEVFGMTHIDRGSAWAQYTVVKEDELVRIPKNLTWEEAASLPLSALTAYQAIFEHAKIPLPEFLGGNARDGKEERPILITGQLEESAFTLYSLLRWPVYL
ncbi:hypothetical protein N7509_000429 [Penicillium cosmopolitanum]|uniref:Enoyl reductase (ER) domain-containing protein n=1 Tax=Penicillium cosmopolitanum TaxID=1131564 RepID=A0A9W9WAQ9_9EURO|nr:uncharacterized protein N7509_000429 [Penicillium cosmopolitanum]KAJ5413802.1 hypothetical protein N7509_000429 [Penicillium cosmopolitanum]